MSDVLDLLERAYERTSGVLAAVPPRRWDSRSPCTEWTVREVAGHLVEVMNVFAAAVEHVVAEPVADPSGFDPSSYDAAAARCLAAFGRPDVLDEAHPFPFGPTPGHVIAHISMSESLVHGWDVAKGAGLGYEPDPAVVAAVAGLHDPSLPRPADMFAAPVPAPPAASGFTALLALLGRSA